MGGTATIHQASLDPDPLDLLRAWLPEQAWFEGRQVDDPLAYRFVDPDGEVGLETFLLADESGQRWQVALSHRGAPLVAAEDGLVGTMEHSVLGGRWSYDAVHDPVWRAELVSTIVQAGHEAARPTGAEPGVRVRGTGGAPAPAPGITRVVVDEWGFAFDDGEHRRWLVQLARRVGELDATTATLRLVGRWQEAGGEHRAVLATVEPVR